MAPWRAAATGSAGSGDQPSTRGIPARLADSATEPPVAPSPMTPSVWGRTAWKLVGPDGGVNADAPRPAEQDGHASPASTGACPGGGRTAWPSPPALRRGRPPPRPAPGTRGSAVLAKAPL